jgi:XTP/dITP diphosphohydrolase
MSAAPSVHDLVIGTRNRKKGEELAEMLAPWGFRVKTLADVAGAIDVVEDGDSFAANAAIKATQQARHLGRWVLADDSGLEVDALGGKPGIYSARFAGPRATDDANNRHLLAALADTPLERRAARYVCHVAVADPGGVIRAESHDTCRGLILLEPHGTNGFGYDPLFEVVEYHRTFGQLGPRVKQALSHRSRALRAMLPQLLALKTGCEELGAGGREKINSPHAPCSPPLAKLKEPGRP